MHGVTLTLEADHAPLLVYAAEHLNPLVTDPVPNPDLLVRCHWSEGQWEPEVNPFAVDRHLNIVGNRMLGNTDELVWLDTLRKKGLQLRFRRKNGAFIFDVAYRLHQKEKAQSLPGYEQKKYFGLMSELVYHPLIWFLERQRGWVLLHAAAMDSLYGGIVICGLGGVGKSTTCVALIQQVSARLISENLVLTDGDFVYGCYEPVRLDAGSLELLGDSPCGLTSMTFPEGLKPKSIFHLCDGDPPERVQPNTVFLPQFSAERYVRRLDPDLAAEKILALNGLVREVDDYHWYASALNMAWPKPGQASRRIEAVRLLTRSTPCFELGIDRSAGVEAVVGNIVSTLGDITRHSLSETRR
jgi:hypothetical protein